MGVDTQMSNFEKKWAKQEKESFGDALRDSIRPKTGMREGITAAQRSIKAVMSKLDAKSARLKEQDSRIFQGVVTATQTHDTERASIYANELAEIRKIHRHITQTRLVLEQINLRIGTAQDMGDVVASISPIISVVKGMRGSLQSIMPDAGAEMEGIGNMLNDVMTSSGELGGSFTTIASTSEESEKILAEASTVVGLKTEDKFPDIPNPVESGEYNQ